MWLAHEVEANQGQGDDRGTDASDGLFLAPALSLGTGPHDGRGWRVAFIAQRRASVLAELGVGFVLRPAVWTFDHFFLLPFICTDNS